MLIAVLILVALVAFCFGVGCYGFFAACKRIPEWKKKPGKSTKSDDYSDKLREGNQWLREHETEELFLTATDGTRLHAWWIPAEKPRATVVFAHGYHSCGAKDFSVVFDLYHDQGFNILLPDQRAHGASGGKFITFGVKESEDFRQWIALHNERFGAYPILCSGLSMGASTVMFLAGLELPENVKGFIADCGFTSPREIISSVFRHQTHLPTWPFLWATDLCARWFAGFSLKEMHTTQTLAKNTRPILFVHGLDDTFVPPEMTKRSFEACGGEKYLLLVEGATHAVSFLVSPEAYLEKRNIIAEKVLGEPI